MDAQLLKNILEAGLLVAAKPMTLAQLDGLFEGDDDKPNRQDIKAALESLKSDYEGRGIELVEIASGYRLQSRDTMAHWMARLFDERLPRYSRALLETLVLVAYRQPITRGEIEEIRGVAVSSNIVKTLLERQWVKEVGHKDVPGKPALLGTTKHFLDYFNLKRLDDLPPLGEIKDLDQLDAVLAESMGIEAVDAPENEPAANDERVVESDELAVDAAEVDIALECEDAAADEQIPLEENDLGFDETTAESELKRVIADFADEHQQELDAQREMDARQLSKPLQDSAESAADDSGETVEQESMEPVAEVAAEAESDTTAFQKSAPSELVEELPKPGDTLH